MTNGSQRQIRSFENAHILLWLIKDLCWVSEFHQVGVFMIVPTAVVALYLTWRSRQNLSELVHNSAVCLWIAANSTWMVGEFFYDDHTKPYAQVLFSAGLALLGAYYLYILFGKLRNR